VVRIARIFKDRNDERYVNTKMMRRHAGAFILFLVATIGMFTNYVFINAVRVMKGDATYGIVMSNIANDFFVLAEFISEAMLVPILW
jgi:hypothetical protein